MIQPIYLYGSEVLRAKAEEVDLTDKEGIATLIQDLKDTLKHSDGCGLAAPQIGVSKRALIVDGTGMTDVYDYLKDFKRTMLNPVVLEESEKEVDYSEGCLSIPGIYCEVRRPAAITVEYYDENGEVRQVRLPHGAARDVASGRQPVRGQRGADKEEDDCQEVAEHFQRQGFDTLQH